MENILIIPIKIDSLILDNPTSVVQPLANFERLPYTDKVFDRNPETPFISENIVTPPFSPKNMRLAAGAHLHWALPDALTNIRVKEDDTQIPLAPNRWLVFRNSAALGDTVRYIESDYVHPLGEGIGNTVYPVSKNLFTPDNETFRHIGRVLTPTEFTPDEDTNKSGSDYLNTNPDFKSKLTPMGYGDPCFAAFYPSCHSVFGYHDAAITTSNALGVTYEVYGWHSDQNDDRLGQFVEEYQTQQTNDGNTIGPEDVFRALEEQLDLKVVVANQNFSINANSISTKASPERLICSGFIEFTGTTIETKSPNIELAIGYSGPQALGSYFAEKLSLKPGENLTKKQIEEQFEGILQGEKLNHLLLDIGPKMKEVCHEHGFTAFDSGNIWEIAIESNINISANAEMGGRFENMKMPSNLGPMLAALNTMQSKYNSAQREITDAKRQLFSDWNKYLTAVYSTYGSHDNYPDIDVIRNFIEMNGIIPLDKLVEKTGDYSLNKDENGCITSASVKANTHVDAIVNQLVLAFNNLLDELNLLNSGTEANMACVEYCLKEIQEPRYWEAKEPVLMIKGDCITKSDRHGRDDQENNKGLDCYLFNLSESHTYFKDAVLTIRSLIATSDLTTGGKPIFGVRTQASQPWNPLLLEWEVEFASVANGNPSKSDESRYSEEYIVSNFQLPKESCDLVISNQPTFESIDTYTGRVVIDGFTTDTFIERLKEYLRRELAGLYLAQSSITIPEDKTEEEFFYANIDAAITFYQGLPVANHRSSVDNAIAAYQEIMIEGTFVLSQAIDGFNDQLRQLFPTFRLNIADPIGFQYDQEFAKRVMQSLGEGNNIASLPLASFNPLRAGLLKVGRLRLLDTFGRTEDLKDQNNVTVIEGLQTANSDFNIYLNPRLAQASRINFRWLAVNEIAMEANSHPECTPVCGWIVPVFFDGSFNIYDSKGDLLGIIPQNGFWEEGPGGGLSDPTDIPNIVLRSFVLHLMGQGPVFLSSLIDSIEESMTLSETEPGGQGAELSFITGKPLAIVRSTIDWQLEGQAAIDQSWTAFRGNLQRNDRHKAKFDEVKLPIRVGQFDQLNDGVIGYYVEGDLLYENDLFYAPKNSVAHHDLIKYQKNDDPVNLIITIKEGPKRLVMLVDPFAKVHLTTGILPTKTISILPEHYKKALEKMEILFQVAPMLSGKSKLELPVPPEEGYYWSWEQKVKNVKGSLNWKSILKQGVVQRKGILAKFDSIPGVWEALLEARWLDGLDGEALKAHVLLTGDTFPIALKEFDYHIMDVDNLISMNKSNGFIERTEIENYFVSDFQDFVNDLIINNWIQTVNTAGEYTVASTQNPTSLSNRFAFTMKHIKMLRDQRLIGRGYLSLGELKACLAQGGINLWDALEEAGVLVPLYLNAKVAQVVEVEDRVQANLPTAFQGIQKNIQTYLEEVGFLNPTLNANYPEEPELNEGWLRLNKLK